MSGRGEEEKANENRTENQGAKSLKCTWLVSVYVEALRVLSQSPVSQVPPAQRGVMVRLSMS